MARYRYNLINSLLASSAALWRGTYDKGNRQQPEQRLRLYDMENCPFCRLVREAITELDLDVEIYPCPKGGERFRPLVKQLGGKEQFPFLIDPNTGVQLYESADIIGYLKQHYGHGAGRNLPGERQLKLMTASLATVLRGRSGFYARSANAPEQLLELWSFESSPYARPVRELLCELELPYVLHSLGKHEWQDFLLPEHRNRYWKSFQHQGRNRSALQQQTGQVSSPYFADPNTGEAFYESVKMLKYLQQQYARSTETGAAV